jgi:MFS family permease
MARFPERGASIGFLISTLSITGVVAGLFFGALLARIGFRKPLMIALLLGAVLSAVQTLPLSFPVFLASRVLEGLSHLIIVVAAPTLIGQVCAPQHKAIGLTIWSTVFGIAFALFTWAGLPLISQFTDPNMGLWVLFRGHALGMLLLVVAVWGLLPAGIVPRSSDPVTLRGVLERHRETYSSAWICAPALGWFFYAAGFVALVTAIPLYFDAGTPSFVQGLLPLSSLVVSLTLGIALVRRFPPVSVAVAGFLCAAALAPIMLLGTGAGLVVWGAIAMVGALGFVQAGTFSAIPVLIPRGDHQALANGAMAQMGNAGNVLGTPVLLWLTASFGLAGAVGFSAFLFICGALCHLVLLRLRHRSA